MRYVGCVLVGAASGLLAAVVWTVGCLFGPLVFAMLTLSAGLASSTVDAGSVVAVAILGFAAGAYWQFRRSRRPVGA